MSIKRTCLAAAIMSMGMGIQPVGATVFNQTVHLDQDVLSSGDVIKTTDSLGVDSGTQQGILNLGKGQISIDMSPVDQNTKAVGAKFQNGQVHHLGTGSKITLSMPNGKKGMEAVTVTKGSQLTADQLNISVTGNQGDSIGVKLEARSHIDLGTGSNVKVIGPGRNAYGVSISGSDSEFKANQLTIESSGGGLSLNGTTQIDLGQGSRIHADEGKGINLISTSSGVSTLKADALTINTKASAASALDMNVGVVQVDLGSGSHLVTQGNYAHGVIIVSNPGSSFKANELTIETSGASAQGLEAHVGEATLTNAHITSKNGGGLAAVNEMGDVKLTLDGGMIKAGGSYAVQANGLNTSTTTTTVNLSNAHMTVDRTNPNAGGAGLWAFNKGRINVKDSEIVATGASSGLLVQVGGQVHLSGKNKIDSATAAMRVQKDSIVNADGLLTVKGDLLAESNALINIAATAGSSFEGGFIQTGEGKIDFTGDQTTWKMTKDSVVDDLKLKGSQVNFATKGSAGTLDVARLSGDATFTMRVGLVEGQGDRINVTETSEGQHKLNVLNLGAANTTGDEVITVVTTADGQASFGLVNDVELGGYIYRLHKDENDKDWSLSADSEPEITTTAEAAANSLVATYLVNFAENQSLLKRMGDLRAGTSERNTWGRVYGGKMDAFSAGLLSGFDMDYKGMQFGTDNQVFQDEQSRIYVGGALGLLDSDQHYRQGSGTLKSYSAALYGTYLTDQHFYTDMMLKYARMRDNFDVKDSAGHHVDGREYSTGLSFSAEVGQRLYIESTQNQLYFTPQAQLTLSRLGRMDHLGSNGLKVSVNERNSVLARVGTEIGYQFKDVANPTNLYAKVSFLREFSSNAEYTLNDSREHHSFKGNLWQFGVGVTSQINQNHHVYVDFEMNQGQRFDHRQLNAGYRYAF